MRKIASQKNVVADFTAQIQSQQKAIDQIFADQGRLRENMKALKGSAEEKALLQRYTKQLDDEETQLDVLRKKMKATEEQRDNSNAELKKMIPSDFELPKRSRRPSFFCGPAAAHWPAGLGDSCCFFNSARNACSRFAT